MISELLNNKHLSIPAKSMDSNDFSFQTAFQVSQLMKDYLVRISSDQNMEARKWSSLPAFESKDLVMRVQK